MRLPPTLSETLTSLRRSAKLSDARLFLPTPRFALRLIFGEFANSLFYSQRIVPKVAMDHGFEFKFPNLTDAIADVV